MHELTYSAAVLDELRVAARRYSFYHDGASEADFVDLIEDAFATALVHPQSPPRYFGFRDGGDVYRRINVWHFAFLYRVDGPARQLVIERIFHERTG